MMEDEQQHLCHICPAQQIYKEVRATEFQEKRRKRVRQLKCSDSIQFNSIYQDNSFKLFVSVGSDSNDSLRPGESFFFFISWSIFKLIRFLWHPIFIFNVNPS